MKSFLDFLITESVIDPEMETLDPLVFVDVENTRYPQMQDSIRQQILMLAKEFETQNIEIEDILVKGSILTKNYTPRTDIDVTIITKSEDRSEDDEMWDFIKLMSGKNAIGTAHPINFFVNFIKTQKDLDKIMLNFDNVYSVVSDKWIKKTKDYSVDIEKYLKKFKDSISEVDLNTMELRRDIIDYNALKKLPKKMGSKLKSKVEAKLKNIETTIKRMISELDKTKKGRMMAFKRPLTLKEIKAIKSKNTLPENVIFKFTERYYYFELMKELDTILDKNKLEGDDVLDVQDALTDFFDKTE